MSLSEPSERSGAGDREAFDGRIVLVTGGLGFIGGALHQGSHAIQGAVVFGIFAVGTVTQVTLSRFSSRQVVLAGASEINANPKDDETVNIHTLLPDGTDPKLKAIGESDRMTLKFVKPKL